MSGKNVQGERDQWGRRKKEKIFFKFCFIEVYLISILKCIEVYLIWVVPDGSDGKESACSAEDLGSMVGSGRSPREGNGYPLQYSCLGNSMDRGAWWATVHGVAKSQIQVSD